MDPDAFGPRDVARSGKAGRLEALGPGFVGGGGCGFARISAGFGFDWYFVLWGRWAGHASGRSARTTPHPSATASRRGRPHGIKPGVNPNAVNQTLTNRR